MSDQSTNLSVPKKTLYRLSIYQRCLRRLEESGVETVSSESLAGVAGVKSTQLRKDLACLGQFGIRGIGYEVAVLAAMIHDVLGRNRLKPVVLVGAGNLGSALLRYGGFRKEGFEIIAAFDTDEESVGREVDGVKVLHQNELERVMREHRVKMAILAVPGGAAQKVTDNLVACGVQGILNFSPAVLEVPERVVVKSVDLAVELENLSYFVRD